MLLLKRAYTITYDVNDWWLQTQLFVTCLKINKATKIKPMCEINSLIGTGLCACKFICEILVVIVKSFTISNHCLTACKIHAIYATSLAVIANFKQMLKDVSMLK